MPHFSQRDLENLNKVNISTTPISAAQWAYLGAMDQGVATTDSVTFAGLALTGNLALAANSITGTSVDISNAELQLLSLITTAGGALIDDADAAAQIATLGLDADIATFALPASTTISAFGATIVDDADAAAVIATLGLDADLATLSLPASTTISTAGAALIDDAAASNQRTTLGLVIGTDVLAEQTINVPHTVPTAETRTVETNEQLSVHGGILTLIGDLSLEGNSEVYIIT